MKSIPKLKFLIGFYLSVLLILLLSVVAMPLVIRHGIKLNEFKFLFHQLVAKITTITKSQWVVISIINIASGQTVKEYSAETRKGALPSISCTVRRPVHYLESEKR